MSANVFIDKLAKPDDQALVSALGKTYPLWAEIEKHIATTLGESVQEWKYYGLKSGWTMKTLYKKRNLFFFTAYKGYFRIAFVFGDRAVAEIVSSDLPKAVIEEITNAKKYAEGRGIRIDVKTRRDVESVKKLIAFKVMN
jgi:Protein of unknown function (DUF3788)